MTHATSRPVACRRGSHVAILGDMQPDTLNERGRELMEMLFSRCATAIDDLDSASYLV